MYKYVQNLKRIAVYLSLLSDHLIFLQKKWRMLVEETTIYSQTADDSRPNLHRIRPGMVCCLGSKSARRFKLKAS